MKSFWSLKSPSKISVLNIFPPAIMPFGNRRMRRTQKHNTSKLLSAQHSRVAASRSLLSKATLFPWVTHVWENCMKMHSQFTLMSVQLSTAIPNEKFKPVSSSVVLWKIWEVQDQRGPGTRNILRWLLHHAGVTTIQSWWIASARSLRKLQ